MSNTITLECEYCHNSFYRELKQHKYRLKKGISHVFCSNQCRAYFQRKSQKFSCSFCGQTTIKNLAEINRNKTGNFFCNSSCAAKYNNRKFPKRKMKDQECESCGSIYQHKNTTIQCPVCQKMGSVDDSTTIAESLFTKSDVIMTKTSKYSKIRDHAKRVMQDAPKQCALTGYDKHVEVCHIIPIRQLRLDAPLSIVNDPRNLVLLSPNAHWEVDHGFSILPESEDFIEYMKVANFYIESSQWGSNPYSSSYKEDA